MRYFPLGSYLGFPVMPLWRVIIGNTGWGLVFQIRRMYLDISIHLAGNKQMTARNTDDNRVYGENLKPRNSLSSFPKYTTAQMSEFCCSFALLYWQLINIILGKIIQVLQDCNWFVSLFFPLSKTVSNHIKPSQRTIFPFLCQAINLNF